MADLSKEDFMSGGDNDLDTRRQRLAFNGNRPALGGGVIGETLLGGDVFYVQQKHKRSGRSKNSYAGPRCHHGS
eukprot:scaffold65334_cov32-Tisochrysis_lutea.AAC.2